MIFKVAIYSNLENHKLILSSDSLSILVQSMNLLFRIRNDNSRSSFSFLAIVIYVSLLMQSCNIAPFATNKNEINPTNYDLVFSPNKTVNGDEFLMLDKMNTISKVERYIFDIRNPKKIYDFSIVNNISVKADEQTFNDHSGSKRVDKSYLPFVGIFWRSQLFYEKPTSVVFMREGLPGGEIKVRVNNKIIFDSLLDGFDTFEYELKEGMNTLYIDYVSNRYYYPDMYLDIQPNPFTNQERK